MMKYPPDERAVLLAQYIINNNATVRCAAKRFMISKSSVHKDVTDRLQYVDRGLFEQCRVILEVHKNERHLRGGEATRLKYEKQKQSET